MSPSLKRSDEPWDWGSKALDLSAPPPNSGITVTPLPNGARLTVRLHELRQCWPQLCFGLGASGFAIWMACHTWSRDRSFTEARAAAIFSGTVFALLIFAGCNAWYRRIVLTVTGDRLELRIVNLLFSSSSRWDRGALRWITAWQGFRVVADDRNLVLHITDRTGRLDWVAEYLRERLRLPRQLEAQPDEIELYFTVERNQAPDRGFLLAQPGRLALRFDFIGMYVFELLRHGGPARYAFPACLEGGRFVLRPEDVRCTIDAEGLANLEIHRGAGRREFWLIAWCADKDALESALGRFWGAAHD